MGRIAAHAHCTWATPTSSLIPRSGGHGESLRRTRGEAARGIVGHHPTDRCMVNMGTILALPSLRSTRASGGKVRCRLMAPEGDGALVVVRGRESRLHGEGGQQFRSRGMEDQEVA